MVEARLRARRSILRNAESFTAKGVGRKGVFTVISPGSARRFLSDGAIEGAARPIWAILVPDFDTTLVTDDIDWAGQSLTILGIVERGYRGTVLYRFILACPAP
jgi:hypothetical protein